MITIFPIKVFVDNYIWVLKQNQQVVVIDPGDAAPVIDYLKQHQLTLSAILITHHHQDHIGGVESLLNYQQAPIYAPSYGQYSFKHYAVNDQDIIHIESINTQFKVLWLPGHTHDHIAYLHQHHLFCGDIIFAAGCGRVFDGTLRQHFESLQTIKQLAPETLLYCAHEYTSKNIEFAQKIDPNNETLIARAKQTYVLLAQNQPTIPTLLKTELETNPFLRTNEVAIKQHFSQKKYDEFDIFCKIRELRNHY